MKRIIGLFIIVLLIGSCGFDVYPQPDLSGVYTSENDVLTITLNNDFTGTINSDFVSEDFSWDYITHNSAIGHTFAVLYTNPTAGVFSKPETADVYFDGYGWLSK